MNLRECTRLVIDHRQETFSYVFPQTTIVKPIVRPEMITKVAALMEYAGAEIKVIREEHEERVMNKVTKMSTKTHSLHDMLRAVWEGQFNDVNGNTLKCMENDGVIEWSFHADDQRLDGWYLTEIGRRELGVGEFKSEAVNTPALSEDGVRAAKAVAALDEATADYEALGLPDSGEIPHVTELHVNTTVNGRYKPEMQILPGIVIPVPSESERKTRKAAYAAIRYGLDRALSGGQALVPILDSLEETDPLLDKWSGGQ